jgi:hypothetical protein
VVSDRVDQPSQYPAHKQPPPGEQHHQAMPPMALLTHKVSKCTDNYSLFAKDKPFYGIPYLDRSRSSIPSEASSFFSTGRSFRESNQDLSLNPASAVPRTIKSIGENPATPSKDTASETIPCRQVEALDVVPPHIVVDLVVQSDDSTDMQLEDFDEDEDKYYASNNHTDNASFVTAESMELSPPTEGNDKTSQVPQGQKPHAFNRWISTMLRKPKNNLLCAEGLDGEHGRTDDRSMASSYKWVSAVCTASLTLASFPSTPRRKSIASSSPSALDSATIARMMERNHTLQELITTEEYYLQDLRSLKNVCTLTAAHFQS